MTTRRIGDIMPVLEERQAECEKHGAYQSMLMRIGEARWTGCPVCAREQIDARERIDDEEQARRMRASRRARRAQAGIPRKMLDASVAAYKPHYGPSQYAALGSIRDYGQNLTQRVADGLGLILMGRVGTGKTHLGCALLSHGAELDKTIGYSTAEALFMRVRETYNRDGESEADVMRAMVTPDLLMLDEIGAGRGSDHELNVLASVLTRRYDECKATILATNLDPERLRHALGDRVVDRMREVAEVIEFDWPSYRAGEVQA